MDPEQTFIRVQERFAQMLTPRIRATLEYLYLFMAVTLFCILVVMHANYVQQPGCSSELSRVNISDAQLIQIKITSAGLWSQNQTNYDAVNVSNEEPIGENMKHANEDSTVTAAKKPWLDWLSDGAKSGKSLLYSTSEYSESSLGSSTNSESVGDDVVPKISKEVSRARFFISPKESLKAAIIRIGQKWHGRLSFIWRVSKRVLGGLWDIAGIHLHIDIPKLLKTLHLDKLNSYAVQWLETRSKAFEPTYLYTKEKGYLLLPEEARLRHNIHTINISISARHSCFEEALIYCADLDGKNIMLETDSLVLKRILQDGWRIPWEHVQGIENFKELLVQLNSQVKRTYIEGNHLADYLTNIAMDKRGLHQFYDFHDLSTWGRKILDSDKAEILNL
ncbi:hypothetical protein HAX54_047145 [Datura stramonium]|uniref:RNase H type-1 domain-containing protein n=1 Tax=Datura stramonium TaxID=4076 RepID=A0ABS8WHZ3_DATST|nr:hypothetical protein [Datura stramonium]